MNEKSMVILGAMLVLGLVSIGTTQEPSEPRITGAYVDPLKVVPGDTMLVSAAVEDEHGIANVTADMGGIETIELGLVEGTTYDGLWQEQWLVHDTEVKDYNTTITATNVLGLTDTVKVEWSDPDPPLILFWDNDTVDAPTGWTCISCDPADPFYNKFIRGNASYGGTGGNATHTHPVNWSSSTQSDDKIRVDGQSGSGTADEFHTHNSLNSGSTSSKSLLPRYRSLKVIAYNNGIPATIPAGVIAIFNSTLPPGWSNYTPQDGYFLVGNDSVATGGSNTPHTHSVSITTGGPSAFDSPDNSGLISAKDHTHDGSGTTLSGNHVPPYINVTFANATENTSLPVGLIGIFNDTPPSGWTSMSGPGGDFADNFTVGSTAYGATGGSTTHGHSNLVISTGLPIGNEGADTSGTNKDEASDSHTHNITVTFDPPQSNLPPYIDVIFAYAVDPNPPAVNITVPLNTTTTETQPDLNFTVNETANVIYNWNGEGNITGCRICTSFNTTYGENNGSDPDIALLFHFNENSSSTAYDDSGNSNDGTLGNATAGTLPAWTTGKFGYALEFDGNDFVNVSDSSTLDFTENLTMAAWVYPKSWSSLKHTYVIGKADAYTLKFSDADEDGTWNLSSSYYNGTGWFEALSTTTLPLDQWSHIASTFNGSFVRLYLNGTEVYSEAVPAAWGNSIDINNNFLTVGAYIKSSTSWERYFNGTIDEVAIYNRSLSGAEILEMYNRTLSGGQHNVTVYATDMASNSNSTTRWFTVGDPTPPNITLNSPANNAWNTSQTINFQYTPTTNDDYDGCYLWTNETLWGLKVSNSTTIGNDSINTLSTTFSADGSYMWNIECNDTAGNSNFSAVNWTVNIDSTPPTISNPQFNETSINPNEAVQFNVTVTDATGVGSVIATFRYPNATEANKTLSKYWDPLTWNSTDQESGTKQFKAGATGYRVQQGDFLFQGTDAYIALDYSVDTNHAFAIMQNLEFQGNVTGATAGDPEMYNNNSLVTAYLYNTTHIRVQRNASDEADLRIGWQVLESFDDEFTVQRGEKSLSSFTGTSTTDTISNAVDPTKTMAWHYLRTGHDWNWGNITQFYSNVSDSTTITFERADTASITGYLRWVVVEWNTTKIDTFAQGYVTGYGTATSPFCDNIGTTINKDQSILIFQTHAITDDGLDTSTTAGNISSNTQVCFHNYVSSYDRGIKWYVIDFGSDVGNRVESGLVAWASTDYINEDTISPAVQLNRSLAWLSRSSNGDGTSKPRHTQWWVIEGNATHADTFRYEKRFGGQNGDVRWEVLELPYSPDAEANKTWETYTSIGGSNFDNVTNIMVTVQVDIYNLEASFNQSTDDPDLQLAIYNGSAYITVGNFSLNETYTGNGLNTTDYNFSLSITDSTILDAWETAGNRDIRIRGVKMDYYNSTTIDEINYTGVWVSVNYDNGTDIYYYDWTDTSAGGTYNVTYVWANDTYGNANGATYTAVSFSVAEVIDVTLYDVPIQFLSTAPGSGDVSAQVDNGYPMNVTIESTTNVPTNLTLKGDANFTAGAYNFSIGNLSYSNTTSSLTAMAASYPSTPPYADWGDIPVPATDTNRSVYFWISIPSGQEAGTYSATVTVKVEKT